MDSDTMSFDITQVRRGRGGKGTIYGSRGGVYLEGRTRLPRTSFEGMTVPPPLLMCPHEPAVSDQAAQGPGQAVQQHRDTAGQEQDQRPK